MKASISIFALLLVAITTAFHIDHCPKVQRCSLSMVLVDENVPGQVGPLGFFDPLGLSSQIDRNDFIRWRESELKHGRLAMMATLAIIAAVSIPTIPIIVKTIRLLFIPNPLIHFKSPYYRSRSLFQMPLSLARRFFILLKWSVYFQTSG
jgi:hypothetical protein